MSLPLGGYALMGDWTYRPPLKSTATVNFASGRLAQGAANVQARDLLRELTQKRAAAIACFTSLAGSPVRWRRRACALALNRVF